MNRNKKSWMYLLFVMTILGITLGYSSLYANLSIDGTTNISSASWHVYWNNIQFGSNNVTTVTTPATISTGKTEVSFNVDFSKPGDIYEFTVDAVNDGTIDAMISVVSSGVYVVNGTTPKTLPDYLEYEVTYDNGSPIEQYHLLESGDLQTYKIRVHYKEDITASQLPSTADNYLFKFAITYAQSDSNAISIKSTCEAGKYLPKGETTCIECTAGSYCVGGTYTYSQTKDQGINKCTIGSYSAASSTTCIACTNGKTTSGVGKTSCNTYCQNYNEATWALNNWNSDNTVTNLCKITACNTVPNISFELKDNVCSVTGTIYSYFPTINSNQNIGVFQYYSNYYYSLNDLASGSFNLLLSRGLAKYIHAELDVEDNVVEKSKICFKISNNVNATNAIYVDGGNAGDYCFESSNDQSTEQIYQYNLTVLKSIFGNNNSRCTETETEYKCVNSANQGYEFVLSKTGNVTVLYDDPDNDSSSTGNPICYFSNAGRTIYCTSDGCLSGDTEVEVYDKKKKKRRRKKLRDITDDDLILCWDFDIGDFVFVEPLWIKKVETMKCYYLLEFSDGCFLKIIGDHKVFDVDRGMFVNAGCDNELVIGSHVYNSQGMVVELISWKKIEEEVDSYNIITNYHMNLFANGILTSCVFSNIYPVENMKYVVDDNDRISVDDLDGILDKYIKGLRLDEVPVTFRGDKETTTSYIKQYVDTLITKEKK